MSRRVGVVGHWQWLGREIGGWFATCSCGWQGWATEATQVGAGYDFELHLEAVVQDQGGDRRALDSALQGEGSPHNPRFHVLTGGTP